MSDLPSREPLIVRGPGVVVEAAAEEQLRRVAIWAGCVRAVGLPDLHPGPGVPVGAAFAFDGVVRPDLVGSDAGCGVRVTVVSRVRASGDDLERRIRREWEEDPGEPASGLGTIGGGNHFAEVSRVGEIVDREEAARLGLSRGATAVVVHSGSRGLGRALSLRWAGRALPEADAGPYLLELEAAVRFALRNRTVLTERLLRALGAARAGSIASTFDVVHNTVSREPIDGRHLFVHRKGAAPAPSGLPTIVLGTRGTPSWIVLGLGSPEHLASVAHGAGRRLVRSEAAARLRPRYTRASLERTRLGGRVLCDDTALMYEEHPGAYKPVDPVVDALVASGAARRVASLHPAVTVKL